MSFVNQVASGVLIIVITGLATIFITDHIEVKANTEHRVRSDKSNHEIMTTLNDINGRLIRIEESQKFLVSKYEQDLKVD